MQGTNPILYMVIQQMTKYVHSHGEKKISFPKAIQWSTSNNKTVFNCVFWKVEIIKVVCIFIENNKKC